MMVKKMRAGRQQWQEYTTMMHSIEVQFCISYIYFYLYTYALDVLQDYPFLDDQGLDIEAWLFYFYPISYLTFSIGILLLTIGRLLLVVHFFM
jgi:hypothetical protein